MGSSTTALWLPSRGGVEEGLGGIHCPAVDLPVLLTLLGNQRKSLLLGMCEHGQSCSVYLMLSNSEVHLRCQARAAMLLRNKLLEKKKKTKQQKC